MGVGFLLCVAHRARRASGEADLDITAPQAALLRLIAAQPDSGVRSLARDLGTDPMNVQLVAETLLGAGLCEPRQDPSDARRRPLYPTDKESYRALLAGLDALAGHDRRTLDPTNMFPEGARSDETP